MAASFYIPTGDVWGLQTLHILPGTVIFCLFHFIRSSRCEVASPCGSDLHFPEDQGCGASLHSPTGHWCSFSEETSVQILCPVQISWYVFSLLSSKWFLNILVIRPLSYIWLTDIFPHSVGWLFHVLMMSSEASERTYFSSEFTCWLSKGSLPFSSSLQRTLSSTCIWWCCCLFHKANSHSWIASPSLSYHWSQQIPAFSVLLSLTRHQASQLHSRALEPILSQGIFS